MLKVSIVLPTYNRLEQLKQVIAGLEKQTYPRADFEVVVVSDGSSDGTDQYLTSLETDLQLVPVLQENQGPSAARNHGVARATGELVIFIDDDVVPAECLIATHVETHEQSPESIVVIGPMLTPPDFDMAPWVRWEQAMLLKQYEAMKAKRLLPTARQFYTGNASVERRHINAAGGFDTTFLRAEDVELGYRLEDRGLKFVFNPDAIGYHYANRTFASWLRMPYDYGRNDVIFARDRGRGWLLPTLMREFHERHILVKTVTRFCISNKILTTITVGLLRRLASIGNLLGMEWITRSAFSGIFNLYHYQGITDELGSRQQFFELVAKAWAQKKAPQALSVEDS